MRMRTLGRGGPVISEFCLGTMTWGSQNSEAEGHAQIDLALERGINFIDTAEMYPTTPLAAKTFGDTERIIGTWLARTGRRNEVVLATKIVGAGNSTSGRGGGPITPETLRAALRGSLERLQTDRVDLYQLHWPNRGSYHFRQNWGYDPSGQAKDEAPRLRAILETLGELVAEGRIGHVGISNETAWGTMRFLDLAERHGLPRVVSIQNEYSLLHRIFDTDLAEICHQEDVGLMAYSPLAAGLLTGKYLDGAVPPGSRASIDPTLRGRINPHSRPVVAEYAELARRHGLDPARMALAFAASRPFMGAVILGATSLDQLASDIGASELELSPDVMDGIAAIHRRHPIPL